MEKFSKYYNSPFGVTRSLHFEKNNLLAIANTKLTTKTIGVAKLVSKNL